MDGLAFIYTNKFIIASFDSNIGVPRDNGSIRIGHIRKIHAINNNTMISVVGNLKKATKIYQYVLALSKLDNNITPEQILTDVRELFPKTIEDVQNIVRVLGEVADRIKERHISDTDQAILFQQLLNNSDIQEIHNENEDNNGQNIVNYFTILNYDAATGFSCRISLMAGNIVLDTNVKEKNDHSNPFCLIILSSVTDDDFLMIIRKKYVEILRPIFEPGWEEKPLNQDKVDKCKFILEDIVKEISPFRERAEVFHYEIGEHTDYKILVSDISLADFNLNNRNSENE